MRFWVALLAAIVALGAACAPAAAQTTVTCSITVGNDGLFTPAELQTACGVMGSSVISVKVDNGSSLTAPWEFTLDNGTRFGRASSASTTLSLTGTHDGSIPITAHGTVSANGTTTPSVGTSGLLSIRFGPMTGTFLNLTARWLAVTSVTSAVAGGSTTVNGNFVSGHSYTVAFGASSQTVTATSDTQLSVIVPAGSGTVTVTVTDSTATKTAGSASFTYAAAPATLAVAMTHSGNGAQGGTLAYTVTPSATGAATSSATLTATFTLPTGMTYTSASGTSWTCSGSGQSGSCTTTTPFAIGNGPVITLTVGFTSGATTPLVPSVSLSGGGASNTASATNSTIVAQTPTITSISPAAGLSTAPGSVAIGGTNFSASGNAVTFGGALGAITAQSTTSITVTPPNHAPGAVTVVVTNAAGLSATASGAFTYLAPPSVTAAFSPSSFVSGGSATLTLTLTNPNGGTALSGVALGSGTLPAGLTGSGLGGTCTGSSLSSNAVSVSGGSLAAGTSCTVTLSVTATAAANYSYTTGTPSASGPIALSGSAASSNTLTVSAAPPTVTGVSPNVGPTGGATSVTLTGTNFTGATGVAFGATAGTGIVVNSATSISVTAPAGTGTVDVTVSTPGGTSATSAVDQYTYVAAPVASAFTAAGVGYNAGAASAASFSLASHVTNGPTGYAVSASTANGGSVSVDAAGTVSYTPPVGFRGTDSFTYTASNAGGSSTAATVSVPVGNPSFTVALPAATGTVGTAYNVGGAAVTVAGGKAPYAGFSATGLPNGLGISSGGVISGTPTASGAFTVTIQLTDSSTGTGPYTGSASATLTIAAAAPTAAGKSVSVGYNAGAAAGTGIDLSGDVTYAPKVRVASAPAHGTLDVAVGGDAAGTTLVYTPTPGFHGADSFTYRGVAADGTTVSAPATVSVTVATPTITASVTGAGATIGAAVSGYAVTPAGGAAPYGCTLASGSLHGLTLNADCSITGTPTSSGTASFTTTVTDSSTGPGGASPVTQAGIALSFAIATGGVPSVTALSPATGPTGGSTSVTLTGSNFLEASAVHFGVTLGTGLVINSASSITITSPAGSGTVAVTVTTPGGTSAAAAGNQFSYLAPPVASAASATVAYDSTNNPITLNLSGGTAATVAVSTPATNGTATASGTAISYTPHAGYYGSDSFSYTATNASGTSTPATVSITVSNPPVPTVAAASAAVPYDTATAINLSASITGVHGSIAVASGPTNGATTVSGDVVTYTPTAGYNGADSFTYTATGPGGTSSPATVTITVATPPAPTVAAASAAVAYDTATAINLAASITGVHGSIAVATSPTNGATSVSGDVVTYTPTAGYHGADSFTYTATGPGGTSAPATVKITVATPPAPSAAAASATVAYNTATAINLAGSITGVHGSIAVATSPTNGATSVSGDVVTYTPTAGYHGADSFTYTATGPGGTSAPATVTITVGNPAAPTASDSSLAVAYGSSTNPVPFTTSGVVTTLTIVTAPVHGTLSGSGTSRSYTPTAGYGGSDTFTFKVGNSGGDSAARTVSITIGTPTITLAPTIVPDGTRGIAYSQPLSASGGSGSYGFALTAGALPAGLSLATNGTLAGTPAASGSFAFTVTATDTSTGAGPYSAARGYTLTIAPPTLTLAPAAGALPGASAGTAYSQSIAASGGTAPYNYAVTSGALPAGIALASNGTLAGSATQSGSFSFTITATDAASAGSGGPYAISGAYTLAVGGGTITVDPTNPASVAAGTPASHTFTASGGVAPYSFAVTAGALPAGVALSTNGTLSGTPSATGTFTFTVQATDSTSGLPATASHSFSFSVTAPTLAITTPAALPAAKVGTAFSQALAGSGGTTPYSFALVSGAVPGLSLSGAGVFSGTPTVAGDFAPVIRMTDGTTGGSYGIDKSFTIKVAPALTIAPSSLPAGTVGIAYSATISGGGGTAPYSFAVTAGALPAGVTLAADGTLSGTPSAGGSFALTVTGTDATSHSANQSYTLSVTAATITLTPATLPGGTVGAAYSQTIVATGGTGPHSFAITAGALPAGLGLGSTGLLSGTATGSGSYAFTVTATDSSTGTQYSGSRSYTLVMAGGTITVSPSALPAATAGAPYSQALSASGGVAPYSYALTGGTLPAGLALSSAGVVSGTPTAGGAFAVTITATDSAGGGGPYRGTLSATLTVGAPTIVIAPAALPAATVGTAYSQAITASGGTGSHIFAVTGGALPAGVSLSSLGILAGTPSAGGTFAVTISATDQSTGSGPFSASKSYSWTVGAPALTLPTATLPDITPGHAYVAALPAPSGGTAPYHYALTGGALPAGLTLGGTGALSGTPTVGGAFSFTATVTDSSGGAGPYSASQTYKLATAAPVLAIAPATLPATAVQQSPYSTTLTASGGIAPYGFAVTAGAIPAGLTLSPGGTLSGTPTGSGSFTFTITATDSTGGSGPYSVARAYTFSVAALPAPTAAGKSGVAVPYETATAIDLSGSITGAHSSIAASAGAHGTTSVSGDVVTYTPTAGYYGSDAFTYTATGPGGTSAPATVSLTVAAPAAPVAAGKSAAIPYGTATAINLSSSITGVHSSIAASAAAHGTSSVSGDVVTYTPATGYYGNDAFTYTASGPGGTSAPATVSLTIAAPAAPVAAGKSAAIPYGTATAINLSGSITGVHSSIAASAGAHGTTSVSGDVVTYTPTAGYFGSDAFTYTATGPGGTSAAATVSLTVAVPAAPIAAGKSAAIPYDTATAIDLTSSITGVHSSITASAGAHGTTSVSGNVVTYTPAAGYFGSDAFTYTATGPGGTSAAATVSLTIATPAAPVAVGKSAAIPYGTATAINLASSITGVHSSIAASAGAHGTTSVSGDVVTYTPAAGYFGSDAFTYTVTGPGGTSAAATVSLAIATPAAPVVVGKSVSVGYGTATAIDLSGSITGVHSSIAASAAAHGTTSVSGNVVTYTPAAGYFGSDAFTYTATGPGGTSPAATVSLTVSTPPAPVATPVANVAVGYGTSDTAIDLSSAVSGAYTSIAATPGAHGTTSVSGAKVTYVPTSGYSGPDSFSYTATGPGGNSAPASVGVIVGSAQLVVTPATLPTGQQAVAYSQTLTTSGGAAPYGYAVTGGSLPAGLSLSSAGLLSGTPSVNGSFPVTITVTDSSSGSGPFHAATGYTLTIAAPAAPSAHDSPAVSVAASTPASSKSVDIDLSALVTGIYTDIRVATSPQHGSLTIHQLAAQAGPDGTGARFIATYTPATNYQGADRFTFLATGPGGSSTPAAVSITVTGTVPSPRAVTATTVNGRPVTVDITTGATAGPFTGAAIVSITPTDSVSATLVEGGTAGDRRYQMTVTPTDRFSGTAVIQYTLSNAFGTSAPATVTVTVTARPDPTQDPAVRALSTAQAEAARRFGAAQIDNFSRRNEQLHGGGGGSSTSDALGIHLTGGSTYGIARRSSDISPEVASKMHVSAIDQAPQGRAGTMQGLTGGNVGAPGGVMPASGAAGAAWSPGSATDTGEDRTRKVGSLAIWSGGAIQVGTRDATTKRDRLSVSSAGLSAGIDVKLAEHLTVGAGGGYGGESTRIADDAAHLDANSWSGALYGSFQPIQGAFIDAVVGAGELGFDTRRTVSANASIARGHRDGSLWFGSLATGIDRSGETSTLSAYARAEYISAKLNAFTEGGADIYNLKFGRRDLESLSAVLGLRGSLKLGAFEPRARFEWRHEFNGSGAQALDYADLSGLAYRITDDGWLRDAINAEIGTGVHLDSDWILGVDLGASLGNGSRMATGKLSIGRKF